ncbi:SigE-dependent sporulation protein [Bacillaceae bacterium SIJ1]|uniref:sporulation YhaL family protein n=1 Tax=Litoribacterium kuwaitense TaxID=1398745 RepID=UPI0013E9C746|nr:sporulation YhaL family protein [Litoribacterium kuwaitense]NGP43901.1 SigE-dependent sporulation protein [Litoribacterium kuwaitense]
MESFILYGLLAGILFCATMILRTGRQEDKQNEAYIEQEGQKYIERLEEEKRRRSEHVESVLPLNKTDAHEKS